MRTATYQVIPEKHGRGVFIYTSCGHQMYSIRDEMAYHGVYALPVFKMERKLHFIFRGQKKQERRN